MDQSVEMHQAFTDYGVLINSGEWGGKLSQDAIREMAGFAEERLWLRGRDLSHPRLGYLAPAFLGRAHPDHLLRRLRHGARADGRFAGGAARDR